MRVPRFFMLQVLVVALAAPAYAGTITASNEPAPEYDVWGVSEPGGHFAVAESFTATLGGLVESVEVHVKGDASAPTSIVVDLYATGAGGVPTSLVGSGVIAAPTLTSSPAWLSADFTGSGVVLASGGVYALRPRPGSAGGFTIDGSVADTYAGGQAWSSIDNGALWSAYENNGYDLSFRVTVPEAAPSLLAVFLLGALAFRRRELVISRS